MLGLNDELVMRHPFPGPGLSINVLCSTGTMTDRDTADFEKATAELQRLNIPSLKTENFSKYVLPVKSVGVQGDFRTYRFPSVISFGNPTDDFYKLGTDWDSIEEISSYITNNTENINRTIIRLYEKSGTTLKLQEGYCDKRRLDQLRAADDIVLTELHKTGWYNKIFQHLTIDLPYASRPDRCSFVLRPVVSEDVMTARFAHLPVQLLDAIVRQIAALGFVDALYFDATNKPPATFGWE
jgi:GMP synthase (glutamine-hydrolysing)